MLIALSIPNHTPYAHLTTNWFSMCYLTRAVRTHYYRAAIINGGTRVMSDHVPTMASENMVFLDENYKRDRIIRKNIHGQFTFWYSQRSKCTDTTFHLHVFSKEDSIYANGLGSVDILAEELNPSLDTSIIDIRGV